jgi:hypothetical protein
VPTGIAGNFDSIINVSGKTYIWSSTIAALYRLDAGGGILLISTAALLFDSAIAPNGVVWIRGSGALFRLYPEDDILLPFDSTYGTYYHPLAAPDGTMFFAAGHVSFYGIRYFDEATDTLIDTGLPGHYSLGISKSVEDELFICDDSSDDVRWLPWAAYLRSLGEWIPVKLTHEMLA